jgi:hypothetical protein
LSLLLLSNPLLPWLFMPQVLYVFKGPHAQHATDKRSEL